MSKKPKPTGKPSEKPREKPREKKDTLKGKVGEQLSRLIRPVAGLITLVALLAIVSTIPKGAETPPQTQPPPPPPPPPSPPPPQTGEAVLDFTVEVLAEE